MINEIPFGARGAGMWRVVAAVLGGLFIACLALAHTAKAASALPDGRAYEQVSPINKNGNNIQSSTDIVQAAADGNRITYFVGGGIPGGTNSTDLPVYLASRGAAGWNTVGLSPPPTTGPRGYVAGWSDDLLNVFSTNFQFEGPLNVQLFDLDTGSGAFSNLTGNRSPQAKFVGASADEQFVAFEDPFAEEALYVTDRASGATVTASKLNSGLPVEFAVAGPTTGMNRRRESSAGRMATSTPLRRTPCPRMARRSICRKHSNRTSSTYGATCSRRRAPWTAPKNAKTRMTRARSRCRPVRQARLIPMEKNQPPLSELRRMDPRLSL